MSARMRDACGLIYSEQGLSRGNRARSSTTTSMPARARTNAVEAPAGPPPTITTWARDPVMRARSRKNPDLEAHGANRPYAWEAKYNVSRLTRYEYSNVP